MNNTISQAIVLSAGLGTRMGELTKDIPKPMLEVNGISLIERHLNYLHKNDILKVVINTFYKAEILENFVKSLPISKKLNIFFSREEELLGTAGGIKNALSILGKEPFFVINNDVILIDDYQENSSFKQLQKNWQPSKMKILILLAQKNKAFGYWANGDFDLNTNNQLTLNKENGEFIHAGMSIMDYRSFEHYSEKVLQLPALYKDMIKKSKLYGEIYQGKWYHIGDLKAYEQYKL